MKLEFNRDTAAAPYDAKLLVLCSSGAIHTVRKTTRKWVKYPGTDHEIHGDYDDFDLVGVGATYGGDPYVEGEVRGWILFENIIGRDLA